MLTMMRYVALHSMQKKEHAGVGFKKILDKKIPLTLTKDAAAWF
jgi:hypothetical protein